jgi:O-antigen/teichoic acid export membrane protein
VYALLGDSLIHLLYGARYADAVLPLRMLGAATVFYAVNSLAATVLIARDRPGTFSRLLVGVGILNIVMNLILIPPYGAAGAAFTAAVSGLLLAVLSVRCVTTVVGRVSLVRALTGPTLAGLAMTAAILPFDLPLVPAAAIGTVAYVAVLAGFERLAYPEDFAAMLRLVKRRARSRPHADDAPPGAPLSEPDLGVERL